MAFFLLQQLCAPQGPAQSGVGWPKRTSRCDCPFVTSSDTKECRFPGVGVAGPGDRLLCVFGRLSNRVKVPFVFLLLLVRGLFPASTGGWVDCKPWSLSFTDCFWQHPNRWISECRKMESFAVSRRVTNLLSVTLGATVQNSRSVSYTFYKDRSGQEMIIQCPPSLDRCQP